MASLKKRGKYYYIKFSKMVDGDLSETVKSLGLRYKDKAEDARAYLEQLEERGKINPYSVDFDPRRTLQERTERQVRNNKLQGLDTVRKVADYFYRKKAHLSDKTVKLDADHSAEWGTYQRAIELFIDVNDCAGLNPRLLTLDHFENMIFRPGLANATRKFYYRQLRVWWNFLKDRDIVSGDIFKRLRKEMPESKGNVRRKMINEQELKKIFNTFDEEIERKKKIPEFRDEMIQHWFKPVIACYFYGGLRKSEVGFDSDLEYSGLKGLNLEYIEGVLEMIYIPATKGRKERVIPISQKWKQYLLPYLKRRGPIGYDDYLFVYNGPPKKGWPVTGYRAYREFKRYAKLAGLPDTRTLHGMRHRRITTWLEDGYSLKEGQLMAGHSSAKVTEGYTHLVGKNLLKKQREIEKRKNGDR